jgi:hypothetical protein
VIRNACFASRHAGICLTIPAHQAGFTLYYLCCCENLTDLCQLLQICEAYSANRYPFPEDQGRRREMNHEVNQRLQELHTTIDAGALVVTLHSAGCHCCVALQRHV